jgi:hypothetical protein
VHDFSIKDILNPDSKRVRRHLSAVINFAKFREEPLTLYSDLLAKVGRIDAPSGRHASESLLTPSLVLPLPAGFPGGHA